MIPRFSRRAFSLASLAAPVALLTGSSLAGSQTSGYGAVMGATRRDFDAEYGTPRQEGSFHVYDFRHNGQAAYWVRFDASGHAEYVEIDFTALPGGGLEFSRDILGKSRFIPGDGGWIGTDGAAGHLQSTRSAFYASVHRSDWLSAVTGRSGFPIVVDEFNISGDGRFTPSPIQRTFVSMETYEVNPAVANGTRPGIEQDVDDWSARYGSMDPIYGGYRINNPPVAGRWLVGTQGFNPGRVTQIDASFDIPISTRDAAAWVGSMVKATGMLAFTYWMPPTPNGSIGLRIHVFNTYRYEYVTSIQYVNGPEQTGTVDRILLAHTHQFMEEGY